MPSITLDYEPQEKQLKLHTSPAKQIFYGGAAGGGKSHSLRWELIRLCLDNPGLRAFLFRRSYGELYDNHISRLREEIPPEVGEYSESRRAMEFKNGSTIRCCYCELEKDVMRYHGAELHVLGLDEASLFTPFQISYLRGRVRMGAFKPTKGYEHVLPRIIMTSNPGGPSHGFLKRTFINPVEPETLFYDKTMANPGDPEDKGWLSVFIPAGMKDNKYLEKNYAGQFVSLGPEMFQALTEGDWDAVVGQALHSLSKKKHQIRPFKVPGHWTKFMSIDWGSAKPFSVVWFCVSDGALLESKRKWKEVWLPPGALIVYREYYGWNGNEDQGCGADSRTVAKKILEIEDGEVMDYRIGDSSMWSKTDGPTTQENMSRATGGRFIMRKSKKDREHNYQEFLCRLSGSENYSKTGDDGDHPMFFATQNCEHFWRTVPTLTLDKTQPEKGPNSREEDHIYDSVVYGLRSRPFMSTKQDREDIRWGREMRKARGINLDPYASR